MSAPNDAIYQGRAIGDAIAAYLYAKENSEDPGGHPPLELFVQLRDARATELADALREFLDSASAFTSDLDQPSEASPEGNEGEAGAE